MILLIAYLSDIFWKNLNVLVYAKLLKSDIYHNIRTVILALDYPTCVGLFMHSDCNRVSSFYSKIKCTGWNVWVQNRSDSDEVFIRPGNRPSDMIEAEIKMPLKTLLWRCTKNWVKYHDRFTNLINLWQATTCGSYHQAGELWNNTLAKLFLKLVIFSKSPLVMLLSLIGKPGDRHLKETCISQDGNRKIIKYQFW